MRARSAGLAAGLAVVSVLGGCGGSAGKPAAPAAAPASAPASVLPPAPVSTPTASPSAAPRPTPTATPDPGRLPQTEASPSATTPAFDARMREFWAGVTSGTTAKALPAFFPLTAYQQVKALADPAADWRGRLVALYDLDLGAAHSHVGAGARLEGVDVPAGAATWVQPGQEYNKIGYWRVYGTRVRYRTAAGTAGSFGIYSLISWRGQWYIVHFGPINHPSGAGAYVP